MDAQIQDGYRGVSARLHTVAKVVNNRPGSFYCFERTGSTQRLSWYHVQFSVVHVRV